MSKTIKTPDDRIIEQLESDIGLYKIEIFELKGEIKILKKMLKDATQELQKNQGFYDDDGNYVEWKAGECTGPTIDNEVAIETLPYMPSSLGIW